MTNYNIDALNVAAIRKQVTNLTSFTISGKVHEDPPIVLIKATAYTEQPEQGEEVKGLNFEIDKDNLKYFGRGDELTELLPELFNYARA